MSLFPDWQEEHKAEHALPFRIRQMHNVYGHMPGKTCRTCRHLLRFHKGASWLKCDLSPITASKSTDWRARWPACGKWEEEME